jgi:hypothetical protein
MKRSQTDIIRQFAELRCLVGFLGEKKQNGWWDCSFLDSIGVRFLETTFPRTACSAAVRSTCEAAGGTHDAAIGRLKTFHLFRFPTAVEDRIESEWEGLCPKGWTGLTSMDEALRKLVGYVETPLQAPQGPVQIGTENKLVSTDAIAELAAHYYSAFTSGLRCFPYFAASNAIH